MSYSLRPYQQDLVDFALPRLRKSKKPLLVNLGTGAGKTWCVAEVAKQWGKNVLVLTVSKELCEQDYEKLKIVAGEKNVGIYSASWNKKEVKPITVATIQSAYKHPEIWQDHKLIIADECLDGECQVLTEQGWVKLCNYDGATKIAQFHPDTQKIDFATPSRVVRKVSTDIWHFQNAKDFEFYATGGHRHLVKHRHQKNFQWFYDDEVLTSEQLSHSPNRWLYCCGNTTSRKATLIEKIGIMIEADGCVYDTLSNGTIKWKVEFSKPNKIKYAKQLLDAASIKYTESHLTRKGWQERGWAMPTKITFVMPEPTVNYKRFLDFITLSDVPTDFVDELLKWDGHKSVKHARWTTARQDEAEFVFTACHLCGHKCHLGIYKRKEHNHQDCYYLDFSRRLQDSTRMIGISSLKKHKIKTDGMMMYCVTVPTSFFLVRRNDTIWVSGNCDNFPLSGMLSELLEGKQLFGLTATPYATQGSKKGRWFTTKIYPLHKIKDKKLGWFWQPVEFNVSEKYLQEHGYLCQMKIYSGPIKCHLLKTNSNGSEYTLESIDEWVAEIYDRIIEVIKGAERTQMCKNCGIIFMPSVESCEILEQLCAKAGIDARAISYKTPSKERDQIISDHKTGKLKWLINQGVCVRGFDNVSVDCLIIARPTRSLRLHRQAIGRGLRICEGKDICNVIDLTENCKTWGGPADVVMGKNGWQDTILLRGKDISGTEVSKINLANVRKKSVENGGEQISRRKNYEF